MTDDPRHSAALAAVAERIEKCAQDFRAGACWPFNDAAERSGRYGQVRRSVDNIGKRFLAHRLAFEVTHGPVPDGLYVLHACDWMPCINPAHLSVGTQRQNGVEAGARLRLPHGEGHSRAVLTESAVQEIRAHRRTDREYADRFGVSPGAVRLARTGINWKHLEMSA